MKANVTLLTATRAAPLLACLNRPAGRAQSVDPGSEDANASMGGTACGVVAAGLVDPGGSATDDKRPEFERMIERTCDGESAFDIIVARSFSRFFLDTFGLEFYLRKLAKHGVRLASITEELGDDLAQVMMRQVIALFDEFEINFAAVVRLTRAFQPHLKSSDDARIVNMSSLFGLVSGPGQTAYAASKFAARGFSNGLRFAFAGSNVGVTVVHPGGVATKIAENARRHAGTTNGEMAEQLVRAATF
jgi:NAD(P)-dependent dehydrogenase (short-subunit alcohol dehydrogenase family)